MESGLGVIFSSPGTGGGTTNKRPHFLRAAETLTTLTPEGTPGPHRLKNVRRNHAFLRRSTSINRPKKS